MDITSQFVSYEIALKLKELGFDEECLAYITPMKDWMIKDYKGNPSTWLCYNVGDYMYIKTVSDPFGDNLHRSDSFVKNSKFTKNIKNIALPLWQQVIDWFREKYNIIITWNLHDGDNPNSWRITISRYDCYDLFYNQDVGREPYYKRYEEAREQAILKAIELCQKEK